MKYSVILLFYLFFFCLESVLERILSTESSKGNMPSIESLLSSTLFSIPAQAEKMKPSLKISTNTKDSVGAEG